MHPYFTKQASNVVAEYIEHFSKEGDTILDCFCGTGVTAIEALKFGRKIIALDINPLACFITEQTIKRVDTNSLKRAFIKLEKTIGKEIDNLDNLPKEKAENLTIEKWYPKEIKLPKNSDFNFVEELWTKRQLAGLALLWEYISSIKNTVIRDQMKIVFSSTIARVNLTYNLSTTRQNGDKIKLGDGGSSLFAQYRYWRPRKLIELKVWDRFSDRFRRILKAKEKWNALTDGIPIEENFKIINGSVLELDKYIEENQVDYIYTDPPYGGNIAYLDLSTMWNAWLGFEVDNNMKQQEIIEGGDLEKTQKDYENLFAQSFEQMGKVLKKDGWLSLVFAHKKLEFWNLIIDSCEDNGLEFKGSVFQPTNNSSVHYKKNPAKVLCSQRIASFKKTHEKSIRKQPDDIKSFILTEIERACLEKRGAPLDYIYQRVLDQLLDNNIIHEAKKKGYLNLNKILDDSPMFFYDPERSLYYIKDWQEKESSIHKIFFNRKNELIIFLRSLLKQKKSMDFSEIYQEIFEMYADEKKFPVGGLRKDLYETLEEIAIVNGKKDEWVLKGEQTQIDYDSIIPEKLVKIEASDLSHSEIIFRLVHLGRIVGYHSWIGKREQSVNTFQGYSFDSLSLPDIPLKVESKDKLNKIKQIDVIWFDQFANAKYAFEVEESTSILSGFERFTHILDLDHNLSKRLFIVAPKSRERKILDVFRTSSFIGRPAYLENKVRLIYKEDLINFYDNHLESSFNENDLRSLFIDFSGG